MFLKYPVAIPLIGITFLTLIAPSAGVSKRPRGDLPMAPSHYSVQFADYRKSSFCPVVPSVKGEKVWFLPTADSTHGNMPRLLLLHDDGCIVQYVSWMEFIDFNGKRRWRTTIAPGFNAVVSATGILLRSSPSGLKVIDEKNSIVVNDVFIPNSTPQGTYDLVYPFDDKYCVQTFNKAEEPVEDEDAEEDSYSLMLKGTKSYDDWVYLHEYSGHALPGLITADGSRVVIAGSESGISVFDIATGQEKIIGTFQGITFILASLDRNDNVIALTQGSDGKKNICCYSLDREKDKQPVWSYAVAGTVNLPYCQPPAIDEKNRVYLIQNQRLHVIENGTLLWEAVVPPATNFQYMTVLGDGSVLCTAANYVLHLTNGEEPRFAFILPPGEEITTPPVVDTSEQIYFGTANGIYCIK